MSEVIRVQVDFGAGGRVWVGCSKTQTIREVMRAAEDVFDKLRRQRVVVREISLRGALLDPDEVAGDWLRDQELLFAELDTVLPQPAHVAAAASAGVVAAAPAAQHGSSVTPMSHGVLVTHEAPTSTAEAVELKNLVSQAVALAVIGLKGCGKTSFVSAFAGTKTASGVTTEKKLEVEGVVHKLLLADSDNAEAIVKQAHGFIVLFDCADRASFNELQARLLGLIVASRGHDAAVPVTIVAGKCDVAARVVSVTEALQLAKELQSLIKGSVALFEVSSPQMLNVVSAVQDTFMNVLQYRALDSGNQSSSCTVS